MTNEELKVFFKKHPIPLICALLVLAVGGGVYYRLGDIGAQEEELAKKSAEAEKYALNIKYSNQLKEQFDAVAAANKKIEGRLTRAGQQGVNTQYFYKIERETGVKIVSFAQGSTSPTKAPKPAYVAVGFTVAVQGTLPQILDFLRHLENGTHYCRVNTAACTVNTAMRGNPLTLSLNLELLGLP